MSLFLMAREPSVYRRFMSVIQRVKRPYTVHFHPGSWESALVSLSKGHFRVLLIEYERLNDEAIRALLAVRRREGFALICLDTAYHLSRDSRSATVGACEYLALDTLSLSRLERALYYALELGQNLKDLSNLAYQDSLSQLSNRMAFIERLQALIQQRNNLRKATTPEAFALLFIDLNRFKMINDTLGHKVGNEVIKIVSERLKRAIRVFDGGGFVARYAGDEFVVVLEQFESKSTVVAWTQQLVEAISRPIHWHSHGFEVGCSIGIAYFPENAEHLERLIDCADTAMYAVKKQNRSSEQARDSMDNSPDALTARQFSNTDIHVREYSASMDQQRRYDRAVENALREALKRNEFSLFYQPRFRAQSQGSLVGVEALLRWNHPERGMLLPKDFLSVAEKNDLIVSIGRWVISQALSDWVQMKSVTGLEHLNLALNFSLNQLMDSGLIQDFQHAIQSINVSDMQGIELEIRENAGVSQIDRIEKHLRFLAQMGAGISLDDFGSGHSSLMHLQRLPIHCIKFNNPSLERSGNMAFEENLKVIKALIGLAHGLGKKAIVEGVETETQHKELMYSQCDFLQGFYYCPPLSLSECQQWMKDYQNKKVDHQFFNKYVLQVL